MTSATYMYLLVTFIYLAIASSRAGRSRESGEEDTHCSGSDGKCCETQCRHGWRGYNGHCYMFGDFGMSLPGAQRFCRTQNTNLLEVEDEDENNWIKTNLAAHPGVCNSPNEVLHTSDGDFTCFWRTPGVVDADDADTMCTNDGGQVADVLHPGVLNFLRTQFSDETTNGLLIAPKWDSSNSQWVTSLGTVQMYLPWDTDQPGNVNGKPCMIIRNGLFQNVACDNNNWPALCSKPPTADAWIGAVDALEENTFQSLMTGDTIPYSNFEDTSGGDTDDCVAYDTSTLGYLWNEFPCYELKTVICEYDADCT